MKTSDIARVAAMRRGQMPTYSWDGACLRGLSYQGFGIDELLRRLLLAEAAGRCDQCGAGDCTHQAARLVIDEILLAEKLRAP